MSGMRTVSLLGPEADGIGTGRTEADNGRGALGGFTGGKKFVDEMSGVADGGEDIGEAPVSRTGNWMRTVSCGLIPGSDGFVTGGGGNWMRTVSFFGWSSSAISVGEVDQKSMTCHYLMLKT
jgi:hypothetical protein